MRGEWQVVIPLKPTTRAKTRLGLTAPQRAALARAFLVDVLAAARQVLPPGAVTVVSGPDDREILPADVVWSQDPGIGLNEAIRHGTADVDAGRRVLVLMGDLPCAQAPDIQRVLGEAESILASGAPAALLSDQAGIGTTALAAANADLDPRFGHRSRAAHRAGGAVEILATDLTRLRRDVDSLVDLADALRLGVGPETQDTARRLGLW